MKFESTFFLRRDSLDQLARVYMDCFAEHPWYEKFRPEDVKRSLQYLAENGAGICLTAYEDEVFAGALFSCPLEYAQRFEKFLPDGIHDDNVMFVAEVFVRRKFRRRGIATALLEKCMAMAKEYEYTHVMQQTHFDSKMFPH